MAKDHTKGAQIFYTGIISLRVIKISTLVLASFCATADTRSWNRR